MQIKKCLLQTAFEGERKEEGGGSRKEREHQSFFHSTEAEASREREREKKAVNRRALSLSFAFFSLCAVLHGTGLARSRRSAIEADDASLCSARKEGEETHFRFDVFLFLLDLHPRRRLSPKTRLLETFVSSPEEPKPAKQPWASVRSSPSITPRTSTRPRCRGARGPTSTCSKCG